MDRANH
ncbi:hypothetical protein VCCP10303_1355, partial [Vibrio cholerae CP1030(3)]